jgi:hypothetical protein
MNRMGRRLGAIALLALFVRAIVPAGFMLAHPDTGSGRYLTLRLCDSHSSPLQIIDLDTGKRVDFAKLPGKAGQKHAPCVCAAAVAMAQPEKAVDPVVLRTIHDVDFASVRDLRPGRGIPAPPPPSTGPPSTS